MTVWTPTAVTACLAALATAAAADTGELHSFHCLYGCPAGAAATNDTIVRENYTLSSNDITKLADWVAYRITPTSIGKSGERNWRADTDLANDETLRPEDYDRAPDTLHIDRGHQAPLAAFSATPQVADMNLLSNITPQSAALNEGPWQRLEAREIALVKKTKQAVYVVTGPLFERPMRPLPAGPPMHRVPSGYWKIVATMEGRIGAFIFDQATPRGADFCAGRVSLLDVELRARLKLFPMVDTAALTSLDADLGCTMPAPTPVPGAEIPVG